MKEILNKIHKFIAKTETPRWLTILLFITLIFRIPSLFEPYYYGDETIYLTLGQGIRQGVPLYGSLHDNKPPLLYLVSAVAGNIFWLKAILAFWTMATTIFFWKLTRVLFPNKQKLQKVAVVVFAILTTIPLLEGNIANAEIFMIGPIIVAFLLLLSKTLNNGKIFVAGILFSIAALFKIPAAFDLPVIVIFWLLTTGLNKTGFKDFIKKTLILASGFVIPIALTFFWYFFKGVFHEYLVAAFLQNIGYLSSWRPGDIQKPFLVKNLPIIVRSSVVMATCITLFLSRKRLSRQFIFTTLWLVFTLFAVTLSERPYPHYLIQSVAPISILLAILISERSLEQSLVVFPLAIAFSVPVIYKFWFYPTTSYYIRFAKFASGAISKNEYFSLFDTNVPRNYKIAGFIITSTRPSDKIFIWSKDSPTIYALSRRLPSIKYTAPYHINDFSNKEDVVILLSKNIPKLIVLSPDAGPFPQIIPLLKQNYLLINQIGDSEIWSLLTPKNINL